MVDALVRGSGGTRLAWDELPEPVRDEIEARFGDRVVAAETQSGGFSPALAARVRLAGGDRAFVKAASAAHNADSGRMYRQEARVVSSLPAGVPVPRLRWWFDDGDWVVLAFDDGGGRPPELPWLPAERDRVLTAVADLARALTPAAPDVPVPDLTDDETSGLTGFRTLAADGHDALAEAYPWVADHLDLLAQWETRWPEVAAGDTLLHGDLRGDNLLLTPDRVLFVDWPSAVRGVAWFDLVAFMPSLSMQGGGDPETVVATHPLTADADPAALTAGISAIAGYFVHASLKPVLPQLPRLRQFQRAQALSALDWLRHRLEDRPGVP